MKPVYTEGVHAHRLIKMLELSDICTSCPATINFLGNRYCDELWFNLNRNDYYDFTLICRVCWEFIGLDETNRSRDLRCPCKNFDTSDEVVKLSWLALEEKGYI